MSRSERLLTACADELAAALDMRFVREVTAGTIADQAYANYLRIEESFVRTAVRLHGLAMWDAPSWTAVESGARVVHALVGEQTEYFRCTRTAWPVPARMTPRQNERSERLSAFAAEAARAGGFAAVTTVLFAAETLYLTWCSRACKGRQVPAGAIADWVAMHAGEPFRAGVDALAVEIDRLPAEVPDQWLRQWFTGMLEAETTFHDAVF